MTFQEIRVLLVLLKVRVSEVALPIGNGFG